MYLKSLSIYKGKTIIRDVKFRMGINLIVDASGSGPDGVGNNIGKTTVLRLIDVCLGGDSNKVYSDSMNSGKSYEKVEKFLKDNFVRIRLVLAKSKMLDDESVILERNFTWDKDAELWIINGSKFNPKSYREELQTLLLPSFAGSLVTFRSLISRNIRCETNRIEAALKTLHDSKSEKEYEALHLTLLGVDAEYSVRAKKAQDNLKDERTYKKVLANYNKKAEIKKELKIVESQLDKYIEKRHKFLVNDSYVSDVKRLESLRLKIDKVRQKLNIITVRISNIESAVKSISSSVFNDNVKEIERIYKEANAFIPELQVSFNELVEFHNSMLEQKSIFIRNELPALKKSKANEEKILASMLHSESEMLSLLQSSISSEEMKSIESCIVNLTAQRATLTSKLTQLQDADNNIISMSAEVQKYSSQSYINSVRSDLDARIAKFNSYFAKFSNELCGLPCALSYEVKQSKAGFQLFSFYIKDNSHSSGIKISEVFSFDMAHIMFSDELALSCLHFLLNDRKELLDNNNLQKIASIVQSSNVQLVLPILKDKLPESLRDSNNIILQLDYHNKLFKIED